ncbi:hypothetical protein Sjap_019125 [Stephania japonica]|uniref:RRM domain-containing protein n=1 Tax=Stephania japonica TaxID=461633 RepID=A0AAP0EY73_9MAGN
MTIDDDNSIYVGGLPYSATEDSIRRVFNLYGSVVAVKIINDREVGGKCYGFVTFTNPRSAIDAISDMNGRTIDGRVVRVNEVRTRGGRPNFSHGNARRDRDMDWDRERDREKEYDHERDHYRDRNDDRSQDHGRSKGRFMNRDRDWKPEHDEKEWNRNHDRDWARDSDGEWDQDRDVDIVNDYDRRDRDGEQQSKSRTSSHFVDRQSRERSSNSSDDYYDQVKEQLEISIQKREELQKEISRLGKKLEDKQQQVLDLQKKSLKLEDALATAKKASSQRRAQLTKFHKCIQQVKDYTERLKSCEQELQSLVDVAMIEAGDDEDGLQYLNGRA